MAGDRRPYFNRSISDLEALHVASPSDGRLSLDLIEELGHRSTERAFALRRKVEQALRSSRAQAPVVPVDAPSKSPDNDAQGTHSATAALVAQPRSLPTPSVPARALPWRALPKPIKADEPCAILSAWIALEALSPQTYRRPADLAGGDQRCVAMLDGPALPWQRGEQSRRNFQLYYQVVLGCVPMDRAMDELTKKFGADDERGRREREKAPIAAFLLDREGMLLDDKAVAVSSFAWALPVALREGLGALGAWPSAERQLVEQLTERLRRADRDGALLPVDRATIEQAFEWLLLTLQLPRELVEDPSFTLRVYQHFRSKNPPEVTLLNSFYLDDLAQAAKLVDAGTTGKALARYLKIETTTHGPNLLNDRAKLEELIAPCMTPPARWPAPGGHPLVTLQQCAVNAIRKELASNGAGIVAVNGPPGTGKTTLLRDLVASCVVDRALAMAKFDDPEKAFRTTGQQVRAGDTAFLHLYRLDESLKGHEVLVASSNNKAVENVSRELPYRKAVGRDISYFRSVADRLACKRSPDGTLTAGEASWGLIAAVLGKSEHRLAFQQAVWWDEDRSLRLYLKAAKGDSVVREIKDEHGKVVQREEPSIVAEAPTSPQQAKVAWKKARGAFVSAYESVQTDLQQLERVRALCKRLAPTRQALSDARATHAAAALTLDVRLRELVASGSTKVSAEAAARHTSQAERASLSERPNWLARLFRTRRYRTWLAEHTLTSSVKAQADQRLAQVSSAHNDVQRRANEASKVAQAANDQVASFTKDLATLEHEITDHRRTLRDRLVDEQFFEQGHEQWNLAAPWLPDGLHKKREDLFASALALHRAFIDGAAQKVLHNLGVLMGAMVAGAFQDEAKKALLGDLWSTLFLAVPVVSTTFASVDRMLGDLPPSSFGWLLVDEAGQATPQSVVGALMRAQRAVVVGDPLQTPPVVSLPDKLVTDVCNYFSVTKELWAAPSASVQTLADEASRIQAEFRGDVGVRRVGLPLLVHRRCLEPMFGISNRIAYDGQMVYAVAEDEAGPATRLLGPSSWLDVDGNATSKWCPEEGEVVVAMLRHLAHAGLRKPDIYVITPFRIVAQELQSCISAEPGLLEQLDVDDHTWLRDRVGTIHTFQGKEAEAVIAVLGAPMTSQQGARRWASYPPNILNVLVSRAKQRLYVVGSRAAWQSTGCCRAVADALPVMPAATWKARIWAHRANPELPDG
jgi:hypothetical protein